MIIQNNFAWKGIAENLTMEKLKKFNEIVLSITIKLIKPQYPFKNLLNLLFILFMTQFNETIDMPMQS